MFQHRRVFVKSVVSGNKWPPSAGPVVRSERRVRPTIPTLRRRTIPGAGRERICVEPRLRFPARTSFPSYRKLADTNFRWLTESLSPSSDPKRKWAPPVCNGKPSVILHVPKGGIQRVKRGERLLPADTSIAAKRQHHERSATHPHVDSALSVRNWSHISDKASLMSLRGHGSHRFFDEVEVLIQVFR